LAASRWIFWLYLSSEAENGITKNDTIFRAKHVKCAPGVADDGDVRALLRAAGMRLGDNNYNGGNAKLYKVLTLLVAAEEATDWEAGDLCPLAPFIPSSHEGEHDCSHNPTTKINHGGVEYQTSLTLKEKNSDNQKRKQCQHGVCKCGLVPACTYYSLN
jgi:hypothetical protein